MQSTNIRQRKRSAPGSSLPRHDTGQLSPGAGGRGRAVWKGQLRVMIRGWGRWYDVPSVSIERTRPQLLQEGLTWFPPAGVLARAPTGPARGAVE